MTGFLRGESFVPHRRTQNNSNQGFRATAKFPRTEPQATCARFPGGSSGFAVERKLKISCCFPRGSAPLFLLET
jgi:hypothetical protein